MAAFEAWLVFLILVVNVVGELQRKRTLAASRGFLAAARLSCLLCSRVDSSFLFFLFIFFFSPVFLCYVYVCLFLCFMGHAAGVK